MVPLLVRNPVILLLFIIFNCLILNCVQLGIKRTRPHYQLPTVHPARYQTINISSDFAHHIDLLQALHSVETEETGTEAI